MSVSAAPWTDLDSILDSADGRACLYGYLRDMGAKDSPPRRYHRHIELLDEVALFRKQAGDAQKLAEQIVERYVTAGDAPGGLYAAAPPPEKLRQPHLRAEHFEPLEAAAREAIKPVVPRFLSDVGNGKKTIAQRVKESGYLAFTEKLNGGKKKSANVCALC